MPDVIPTDAMVEAGADVLCLDGEDLATGAAWSAACPMRFKHREKARGVLSAALSVFLSDAKSADLGRVVWCAMDDRDRPCDDDDADYVAARVLEALFLALDSSGSKGDQ